jgi:hypothetical protein
VKLAILANDKASFVRPLAEGLARMAARCGAEAKIHYDGLAMLSLPLQMTWSSPRSAAGTALRLPRNRRRFNEFVERIRDADVIVVVAHVPSSLTRDSLRNVETLREMLPTRPIVNYDLVYLPTVEKWGAAMLRGEPAGLTEAALEVLGAGSFGMERYDWYLVGSAISEIPLPPGHQPYSPVGIDIDDGSLYPNQRGEFLVLVDFEQRRKNYRAYRELQLRALEKSGIPFRVLDGRLSRDDIRAIYRKTAVFLMAHRESFGLPICELQACGSLIFTPHSDWAGAHWMKHDITVSGPGSHSGNIVVYRNSVDALVEELHAARVAFNPAGVVKTFAESHPHLFRGNQEVLADFLEKVSDGAIHSELHVEHAGVGR